MIARADIRPETSSQRTLPRTYSRAADEPDWEKTFPKKLLNDGSNKRRRPVALYGRNFTKSKQQAFCKNLNTSFPQRHSRTRLRLRRQLPDHCLEHHRIRTYLDAVGQL